MGGKPGPKGPRLGLTEREQLFIDAYLKGSTYADAARAAGVGDETARSKGYMMAKKPAVAAAIKAAQNTVAEKRAYDLEAAIKEIDQRITTASTAKQHSAVAKMMELKMKAHGLLVEKFDVRQSGFQVNIMGIPNSTEERPLIDVTIPGQVAALGAVPALTHHKMDDEDAALFD